MNLNFDTIIETKVKGFIDKQEYFTSVDIGNSIKKGKTFISNKEIAKWLRKNFTISDIFKNYSRKIINVSNGLTTWEYFPSYGDPNNYLKRDQVALNPREAGILTNISKSTGTLSIPIQTNSKNYEGIEIDSDNRIRLSISLLKKVNLKANDPIDPAKITIDGQLFPSGHLVHKDGRISIPKKMINNISNLKVNIMNGTIEITTK